MKVSLKWLKDYVDIDLLPEALAEKLTMIGLEAGDVHTIGGGFQNVFVGEVLKVEGHPNADRLSLATVDLGQEQHTVVCGAPNIAAGQRIAFAKVGARLIDGHSGKTMELKPAKIRGVASAGMVCSEMELGLSDNHEGILILAEDAPVGTPLADYMGDTIFDITITPNRPDCMNVIGIAREIAALTGKTVRLPEIDYPEESTSTDDLVSIEILDPDLCPRYCGGIIKSVTIGQSPDWMQQRLLAAGMRPINNIVDITNFVMLEYGQPLHAFDYDKITEGKIIVRSAQEGEKMVTLDGTHRELTPDMLLITDPAGPVALAGVMGGEDSEVTPTTRTILLESANFNNASIRRTSRSLGLLSEASARFDKGLSPDLSMPAIRRAIRLVVEFAGGTATTGIVDAYPGYAGPAKPIRLTAARAIQVLGIDFGLERITRTLVSLGFDCESKSDLEIMVSVPYWRTDIKLADDLIEEVARIIGYDAIPTTMLSSEIPHHEPSPMRTLRERVQDILVGCGMQEVINYSLTSEDVIAKIRYQGQFGEPIRLANPLSRDQEFLRLSLRGGLLANFAANERHHGQGVILFEAGKIYLPREGELPDEREIVAGIMGGLRSVKGWRSDQGSLDFFYAKGIVQILLERLGLSARFDIADDVMLLPGKTAAIYFNDQQIGILGELHPEVAADFDITSEPVAIFEIEMQKLIPAIEKPRTFNPIPRYPSIDRDIALIVDVDVSAQRIWEVLKSYSQVSQATLFDVYQGKQVPEGKKSLAFALRYQSMERTLTDEAVDKLQQKILKRLEKEVGAILR